MTCVDPSGLENHIGVNTRYKKKIRKMLIIVAIMEVFLIAVTHYMLVISQSL